MKNTALLETDILKLKHANGESGLCMYERMNTNGLKSFIVTTLAKEILLFEDHNSASAIYHNEWDKVRKETARKQDIRIAEIISENKRILVEEVK